MENNEKILVSFDSNTFDKLINLTQKEFEFLLSKVEIFSTAVQMSEFERVKKLNPEKYDVVSRLLMKMSLVQLNSTVFGFDGSGYGSGCAPFASVEQAEYMQRIKKCMDERDKYKLPKNRHNNGNDSFLAMLGMDITIITNDKNLYFSIKDFGRKAMKFEELMEYSHRFL